MRRSFSVAFPVAFGLPAFGTVVFGSVVALGTLVACATDPAPKPVAAAPVKATAAGRDVDPERLCQVIAEVQDAGARLRLVDARAHLEKQKDRESHFGALLSISNDQDRFHAFHKETTENPKSALGPLGECFVYADWKMADQAQAPCAQADKLLDGSPIVDVARATLKRKSGQLAEAYTLVENARSKDGGCAAAHVEAARVAEAAGDKGASQAAWEKALATYPQCVTCAIEAAKMTEATQPRESAVIAWEKALAIAPDSADALKRYGAVMAGHDDAKALAAYDKAIAAGVNDTTTLMGAAALAKNVDKERALKYAEKATAQQPNDVDAWRLVLALASARNDAAQGDPARVEKSAKEILRLVDEDLASHLVLARRARESGDLVTALIQYDRAARAIAAGRTEPLDAAQLEATKKEHDALLRELRVTNPGAKGKAEVVVTSVRKTVQTVFVERLKKKKGMKGAIDVAVVTVEGGAVDTVDIERDTLADPAVAASVVGNLKRATIVGAAKRYSFTLEFQ